LEIGRAEFQGGLDEAGDALFDEIFELLVVGHHVQAAGVNDFSEDDFPVGLQVGGVETAGVTVGLLLVPAVHGFQGGGEEEIGLADSADGSEGKGDRHLVDETGGTDVDERDPQVSAEGTEGTEGYPKGGEGVDEPGLGVELYSGAKVDHSVFATILGRFSGHVMDVTDVTAILSS